MQKKIREESLVSTELKLKATVFNLWLTAFPFLNNSSLPELIIAFMVLLGEKKHTYQGWTIIMLLCQKTQCIDFNA